MIKKKTKIWVLSFFLCAILFSISVKADTNISDNPPHDDKNVFDDNFFKNHQYVNRIKSDNGTKGSSNFNNYDNSIRNIQMGYDNTKPYIQFDYGSPGGNGGSNRYVNFQMEFDKDFRNSDNMIDGDNSKLYYKSNNKKPIEFNLNQNNHKKIITYDHYTQNDQRVYSFIINLSNMNYHSGIITVRLYLNSSVSNEPKMNFNTNSYNSSPLVYLYYKSGDYNYKPDNNFTPEYHVFETAQTLTYSDLINASIEKIQNKKEQIKNNINKARFSKQYNYKYLINEEVKKNFTFKIDKHTHSYFNMNLIKYIVNGIKNSPGLISTQENILDKLSKIYLLKINSMPDLFFESTNSNDGKTQLSSQTLNEGLILSKFNVSDFNINVKLSTLKNNNNQVLSKESFIINNQQVNPGENINYFNNKGSNDGTFNYNIKKNNIILNFAPSPSGKYKGTATWNLVNGP